MDSSQRGVGVRSVLRLAAERRGALAVATLLTLVGAALALAQPLLVKRLVEAAGAGGVASPTAALLVTVFVLQAVLQAAARFVLARTGEGVVLGIRLRLVRHLLRLSMPAFDRQRIGDLISRAGTDSVALRKAVAEGVTDAIIGTVGVVGAVALMIWLDWVLFLVVATLVGLGALMVVSVLRGIRSASLETQRATGAMTSDLERALSAIRTVRASRAEGREAQRIGSQARAAYDAAVRVAKLDAVVGPASELAVTGSFLLVLLVGGMRVASGSRSVGELVAFLLYMLYLTVPVASVFQAMSATQQGSGALTRIEEVLSLPQESNAVLGAPGDLRAEASPAEPRHRNGDRHAVPILEFRNVWFGYDCFRPVLRGVSFQVPRCAHVALIGPSGAGKTTVFALAERFYQPDRGAVLFEGVDAKSMGFDECRARIGLVEQHSPLLHGTVRDNVTYANPHADEDEIRRAVELANLTEVVARLPDGLNSNVGDHGVRFSGGERQRIAIARALLQRPTLLLLDEPTSQLDAANEEALARAIKQVTAACALLVIAHRFSTFRSADQVVVLNDGQVVAVGDHAELLSTNEYYRRLAAGWVEVPREAG